MAVDGFALSPAELLLPNNVLGLTGRGESERDRGPQIELDPLQLALGNASSAEHLQRGATYGRGGGRPPFEVKNVASDS